MSGREGSQGGPRCLLDSLWDLRHPVNPSEKGALFETQFWNGDLRTGKGGSLLLSRVHLFVTPWAVVRQAPLPGFSRQGYWSGLPCPPPEDLP